MSDHQSRGHSFEITVGGRKILSIGPTDSGSVIIIPTAEENMPLLFDVADRAESIAGDGQYRLIGISIRNWNDELTPWEKRGVLGKQNFGSGAEETLSYIEAELLSFLNAEENESDKRRYYLCGYSLAGLFSLWTAYNTDLFTGVAAVSPSVWYPGWIDYAEQNRIKTNMVYLSLGDREEYAKNKLLASVGNSIRIQNMLLEKEAKPHVLEWNRGNHFVDVAERMSKGIAWLLRNRKD